MTASEVPTLDGLVVGRPVDPGNPTAGWLARDLAAARWVLLRSVPEAALTGVPAAEGWPVHPHLLVPRVRTDADGRSWVVVAFVAGERLDRLAGRLSAGELLSLALPLAHVLATVHEAGLRAPGLTAADVLVAASGRPLLDGIALVRGPAGGTPDDDVRELAGLLLARLADAEGPLRGLLTVATTQPPPAAELHRRLARLGPAQPLPVRSRPVRDRHRAARRRRIPLALLAAVAALAAVAGTAWARLAAPDAAAVLAEAAPAVRPVQPSAEPAPTVDWAAVVRTADAARAVAFAGGDPENLAAADAPGSAAEARDRQALVALRGSATVARGWSPLVHSVELLSADSRAAVLRVVDELPPWELVGAAGQVIQQFPARARGAWQVELAWTAGAGWRVADARPDPQVSAASPPR